MNFFSKTEKPPAEGEKGIFFFYSAVFAENYSF